MHFLPIDEIIVPENRIRREFDDEAAAELQASISSQGLFHPLLLRADGRTLIAGERRLRALRVLSFLGKALSFDGRTIPPGTAPCVLLCEADATSALDAELSENTRRQQLTWQEKALAIEALHRLRTLQNPGQTVQDTATEIYKSDEPIAGKSHSLVNQDLLVARHLDDPEVAKAPDRKSALKVIERKAELAHRERLAAEFGTGRTVFGEVIHADMREWIAGYSGQPFDCLIADPPYGVNAHEFANQDAVRHSYEDTPEYSNGLYRFLAETSPSILRPAAHAYLFCDPRRFAAVFDIFSGAGWRVWPWPFIWHRSSQVGLLPWPEHGPRRTYEAILFAIRGDRPTLGVFPDVLIHQHDSSTERGAHKPPALYADLIGRSCRPGDRVVDPCAGTGPILDAAKSRNVWATCVEIEAAAAGQCLERLQGK